MSAPGDPRGILYPTKLPTFHRGTVGAQLEDRVRWLWIPRWDLASGRVSRQKLLPFPASNLVIEPDGVSLVGPTTRASHRDLHGTGWAVGALLRPAGVASLCLDPQSIQDTQVRLDEPELHRAVVLAMRGDDHDVGRARASAILCAWADEHIAPPDAGACLANDMEDLIATDRTVVRVGDIARHFGTSTRSVQRLAQRYIGLSPLAVIRRYRLQEAAQRLREDRAVTIAQVAADLGYADHAHLSSDFRTVLGFTANSYRQDPDHGA